MIESNKYKPKFLDEVVTVWDRERPELEASLAGTLVDRAPWRVDGEDSSGRMRLRLATPAEAVARAIETAELLVKACRKKGWIHITPSIINKPKPKAKPKT